MLGDLCCVCMHNSKIKGSTHPLLPRHVIFCLDEIECFGLVLQLGGHRVSRLASKKASSQVQIIC
jgi:hypothetical protein